MASRDDFIAELIAVLQENDTLSIDASASALSAGQESGSLFSQGGQIATNGSPSSSDLLARQAYDALQYDYPVVDDAQLTALASTYRAITEKRATLADAHQYPLTTKMLDGIEFLHDSVNKRRGSEASGLLAAAVLICIPRFSMECPDDAISTALLQALQPPPLGETLKPTDQQAKIEQYTHAMDTTAAQDETPQCSDDFVEVYAAEEDPDDLSLVYEGSVPSSHSPHTHTTTAIDTSSSATPRRCEQLRLLATKTYFTSFSMISSDKWIEWKLNDALCALSRQLLEAEDDADEVDGQRVFGLEGEWQRYLFVLRDQLLRFSDASEACAGGLVTLKALLVESKDSSPHPTTAQSSDPFFSFTKASSSVQTSPEKKTQRVRIVFRIVAELAVSKEFNSLMARKSQHALAVTIQQLFPVILLELQQLSTHMTQPSFEADHSDFVIVLLQLLHFVVDAAGATAASHQLTIDKLQDSGLLRAWLAFLPPVDASPDRPWVAPLLRLLGESALWNTEFAAYIHRVPKVTTLLETAQHNDNTSRLSCEALLLQIAAYQQHVPLAKITPTVLWTWFSSERIFPTTCPSFIESMEKMSDALFLLDALAKAMSTLRPPIANELRASLQSIYSLRFATIFQYPTFVIPAALPDTVDLVNNVEPEPAPIGDGPMEEQGHEDDEERGRAEALQFLALRNRLRQCAKTILLSRMAGFSSSKLD